VSYEYLGIV